MIKRKLLGVPSLYGITTKEDYEWYKKLQEWYRHFEYNDDDSMDLVTYPADLVKSDIKMYERSEHETGDRT